MKHYRLKAQAVVALREERGLSQAALAQRVGISRPSMCMFEKGKAQPSPETAHAIARVLEVEFGEIAEPAAAVS